MQSTSTHVNTRHTIAHHRAPQRESVRDGGTPKLWDKPREVIEKRLTLPCQLLVGARAKVRDVLFAELRKLRPNQDGYLPKDTVLQDKPSACATITHHHPPSPKFTACAASPRQMPNIQ